MKTIENTLINAKMIETFTKISKSEIQKIIDNDSINLKKWEAISRNPSITSKQIRQIFKILNEANDNDMKSNLLQSKNMSLSAKIKKHLSEHPNMDDDMMASLIETHTLGAPFVLNNPNIKEKHAQMYFDKRVIFKDNFLSLSFQKVMRTPILSTELVLKWYNQLKPFADWEFKEDNSWSAAITTLIKYEGCPIEVLLDVANAPYNELKEKGSLSENNRSKAVNHPNSNDKVMATAYEATGKEEFLSQEAKDIFLF